MSAARFLVGDVFDRMADIEDGSVDLIVTSPPFLALRSYLPLDHPDKSKEIGAEPTPAAFIDTMLALSAEWRRLLAPHGSIAVELGDTYSGSGGAGGDYGPEGLRDGQPKFRQMPANSSYRLHPDGSVKTDADTRRDETKDGSHVTPWTEGPGWPLAKSKTLIPELYRIALAYGIHPLTGQPSPAGTWRIRNVVTWCRPNPPVGALGDKWRPATSDIVVACVSPKRYWDDVATRKPWSENTHKGGGTTKVAGVGNGRGEADARRWEGSLAEKVDTRGGAPLLDYWELPPGGYPGSHYAVYPPALVEPLVKAMTPPRVCVECGEPARRIVERDRRAEWETPTRPADIAVRNGGPWTGGTIETEYTTTGWTDCGHNAWRPALILDPFAGSGTTLMVATGHGHDAIGIDIDERNADLARERVGELFLTVEAA